MATTEETTDDRGTNAERVERMRALLRGLGRTIVAFSGGVDSSFVLRVAREELGDDVLALTTTSASMPAHELLEAREIAAEIGARHLVVPTDEVAIPGYAKNPIDRCWFCKDNLYRICRDHASAEGFSSIVDGVNLDDLGDHRPGLAAAAEQAVRHPLVEAGLGKVAIRGLSRAMGLRTHDKPAAPCLASRFPYGTAITHDRLHRVERAENVLRALGFREFRVRFEEETARLEIAASELARAVDPDVRRSIAEGIRAAGFRRVVVDLDGFRSGSLNADLR
ncbi:MAG: ATP-dependent sacrificial sulfur transferase LarE [Alphaproteobacteria bacterium]